MNYWKRYVSRGVCLVFVGFFLGTHFCLGFTGVFRPDSLPGVYDDKTDVLHSLLRHRALAASKKYQLPVTRADWVATASEIRSRVVAEAGVRFFPELDLDVKETGSLAGDGFSVRNIYFQTRPGVYATANLFVPEGSGRFPAVVVMMGHSTNGKLYENYQAVGQALARDGYVALCIDPWGAGERSTIHGEFEYHGTALGASLMNIGETLLGMQLTDNVRAVDLLRSLPYVDKDKIGATGASGGGNQTMWLAAIDERVKAAVPVVSVGTFESYIGAHNCVCEVLPKGLTIAEEWGILGLVAPRAIKMCNHNQESNPTFFPSEMRTSFEKAKPVFALNETPDHIAYDLYDRPHGYFPEDRESLLGWMDLHLKGIGDGTPKKEKPLKLFAPEQLMVFEKGKRDPLVHSTESYVRKVGAELKAAQLEMEKLDVARQRADLRKLLVTDLLIPFKPTLLGSAAGWEKVVLETADGRLLPLLTKKGKQHDYVIIAHSDGKEHIPLETIRSLEQAGKGIALVDFSGTGEASSSQAAGFDKLGQLHTYGRAALWLGETVIGNWVNELSQVERWLKSEKQAVLIDFYGYKGAGLAGVFYAALGGKLREVHTYQTPASYLFDRRDGVEFFGVGIHLPGILNWGDVSTAAALGEFDLFFHRPVSMSGVAFDSRGVAEIQKEYDRMKQLAGSKGKVSFFEKHALIIEDRKRE